VRLQLGISTIAKLQIVMHAGGKTFCSLTICSQASMRNALAGGGISRMISRCSSLV